MGPALTQERARQGMQVLKKGLSGRQGLPHQLVRLIHPPQHRMEQTCEEIQRASHRRQGLLAMAIVMFEMIALRCAETVPPGVPAPAWRRPAHTPAAPGPLVA